MVISECMRRLVVLAACCCLSSAAVATAAGPAAVDATSSGRPYPQAPAWVADQTLYEVNLRQFSAAGDVNGLVEQLPRLKALGVGTLWLMPVHPIGEDHRSGKLGSPYAPRDYAAFDPDLGTVEQFKAMVAKAHGMGLHVIIDWVAVHTSPDHAWVTEHPDWYKHDAAGQLVHPMPDWKDVVALNYDAPGLRHAMVEAMAHWIRETDIDGFRCDSAEFVPLDFWCDARDALRKIKPVFMLAEGSKPELLNYAFDAAYAWSLPENTEGIIKGTKTVPDLVNYLNADAALMPAGAFRLNFTSNHDKNAWEGTTREQLKDGVAAYTVLTFTIAGMPLIYDGQETGDEHRLNFFDHDPIAWRPDPMADLYRTLAGLKHDNKALWNGATAAPLRLTADAANPSVLAFSREAKGDRVVVMLNLNGQPARTAAPKGVAGLKTVLGGVSTPADGAMIALPPWGYRVWSNTRPH